MSDSPSVEAAWRSHRPYLVNLAYQMLGDVGEAEDVAQEAFLRLSRADASQIDDVRAWLTVVAGRLCLDLMRSARARHEQPDESGALDFVESREVDPADRRNAIIQDLKLAPKNARGRVEYIATFARICTSPTKNVDFTPHSICLSVSGRVTNHCGGFCGLT